MKKRRKKLKIFFIKNQKGLSTIIVTVLLIGMAIVALGIVWVTVSNILSSSLKTADLQKLTIRLTIEEAHKSNSQIITIVKRESGEGSLVGIRFIFFSSTDSEEIRANSNLGASENSTFTLTPGRIGIRDINLVAVIPIFIDSGQETIGDYFSYWNKFDKIVYVQDNYELALLASTYASLINAPLIIQGTSSDNSEIFSGRKLTCVGNVNPSGASCSETYNLEQLQQKYFDETNTDKVILVNPDDLRSLVYDSFYPDKSDKISKLYTGLSISAPVLASAKHELILSTYETNYQSIDNFLGTKMSNFNPNYLTIIASHKIIPNSKFEYRRGGYDFYRALDQTQYADTGYDMLPDIPVGRIAGISNSDVSSYIARDLFYDVLPKTNNLKFLSSSRASYLEHATNWAESFKQAGYNSIAVISEEECYNFEYSEWENQDLILKMFLSPGKTR